MARAPRDPRRPILSFELFMRTGFVSILLCVGAMAAVQGLFAHWPIANRLFGSAPLEWESWIRVVLVGAGVLVAVEAEKAVRRALAPTGPGPGF